MSLVFKELGELVDFKGGGTPSRNVEEYWGNSIPWATVKDLNEGITLTETQEFISELGLKNSASNLIAKGTIIIPTRMALGKVVISEIDVAINQDLKAVFVKDKETLDVKYLLRFLESNKENIASMGKGATVKGITLDQLKAIKIPLQPLAEQRRIASILDQADELRQKRQQAIEKLDQLLQATFIDMFGDPVSNPKGWDIRKLSDLSTKIHSGNTPKGGSENYVDKGIIFLRSQNVWKNKVILDDVAYIDAATHAKMIKSSVKHEDLLMTKTGRINTENSSLGRAAIYLGEDDSANINGHVYLIRIKEGFNKYFILRILTLPNYYEYIRSICVGGIDKRQLNKEHLENFPIIQPPIELQNKFSDIVKVIESQKPKLIEQLALQENLFKTLQNKAFSGTL
ncbi:MULTISPECIES: restriction endonuclease subunit S [Acinetobacter calcoaceticus/baumannii complex]|uniref:Restriction endonuclease subunit S n=3 Tax=Acinetobacter calcoaceticus/baumannii complex TaxID=909768 RepID=A0A2L1VJ14_ACINO|nr:restriction endonuclease subunit S [Acinetobacter nosocomialis]AVF45145.1 restriction endonuclease subunit S [Acinetobacter nosocomialis]MBP1502307.1 restriction endonuclease subunit S [Acinetobacter nosocomialis]MBR7688457.1 restriction endonuclease subunit S [Acinetobacter nosocomialis]MBR7702999.1 restriction endonuclease subunit S [Acinetobacter nosocomialis]MBR7762114.1 restriction endonuclease subunit S [Acinetobacter nosocomialis]